MKYLGDSTRVHIPSSFKRSNQSSTKDSKSNIPVSRRLFGFRGLSAGIGLSVMLVAVALSASLLTRGGSVRASSEGIGTFQSDDCTTPKNTWTLGQQACAVVTGTIVERRITWIAPDGSIAQVSPSFTGTGSDKYTIATTGQLAQTGTWKVESMDNSGAGFAITTFLVTDPAQTANCDLSILKFGPNEAFAGSGISYTIQIDNRGPDAAQSVVLSEPVPSNTTFVTESQTSGPTAGCTNPSAGSTGTSTCTIPSLAVGETATFTFIYNVNGSAQAGTLISNTASVSSATNEVFQDNNSATYTTSVSSAAAPPPCTVICPSSVVTNNSGAANPCSVIASYGAASTTGNCVDPDSGVTPAVVCSPPSGSGFPVGVTNVTCSSGGNTCSFTVTVNETRAPVTPTITCPSDVTVDETSSGAGSAIVSYASPTTTGNCVTVVCSPPSGSSFPVGTTAVNCTGTDSANTAAAPCSFNVTVNSTSGAGCTIACPGDVTQDASAGQCSAVVTYPAATTNGPCGTVTCTPTSGSTFPVGSTPVTCVVSGGPSCDFTVTVNAPSAPTITTCASNKTVSVNANCEGAIPNLVGNGTTNTGEVVTTGCSVVVSQSPAGGTIVGPGTYQVTITAENSAGFVTCTATVTVADTTPPVITTTCPAGTSAAAGASCQAAVPNVTGGIVATDNCTPSNALTVTQSPAAGTLVGVGTTTITVTVKDASNNAATCTTTFTVADTTPPTAVCKNATVALNASGNASITAADVDNGSSDNCGIVSRTVSPSTFTCANKGANTVTLTVTDAANNTATCQATVTVVDNTPPAIACVADINVDFDPGVNGAVVTYTTPVGTDNCPGAVTTQIAGLPSGATFPAGNTTNTFMVTDASGLTAQCSFKVTVALTSLIGLDSVSITGSGLVDSYNSSGGYPATKGSLANVLSNGTITLGNSGKVSGNVRSTRAGVAMSGASQVTGNATAGTTVTRTNSATVGGTITNNQLAPVMTLPSVPACGGPYSPNSGISGTYSYNPSTGDLSLSGVNIATLANGTYCFHNVTLTNSAQLKVNGPVVIKITGTLNTSGATSLTNTTAIPSNLRILSSYTGSNGVSFTNSTTVYLVIYAPKTDVAISGAAPLFGTVAGKTLTISNSGMIHYDTLLKSIWPDIWSLIQ
jgi:uncharacterized repeat protein (TIGR01451 family)